MSQPIIVTPQVNTAPLTLNAQLNQARNALLKMRSDALSKHTPASVELSQAQLRKVPLLQPQNRNKAFKKASSTASPIIRFVSVAIAGMIPVSSMASPLTDYIDTIPTNTLGWIVALLAIAFITLLLLPSAKPVKKATAKRFNRAEEQAEALGNLANGEAFNGNR